MLRNVYLKTLRDIRKSMLWYSIGGIAVGLYVTLFYPTIRDATGFAEFLENLPEVMQNMIGDAETYTTAEGFLNAEMFGFLGPLIVAVFAIIIGMSAVAGEEESHTLDQLLANPITRTQVLLQKAGALLTGLLVISAALWVGMIAGSKLADFDLSISGTTQAVVSQYVFGATLGLLALSIGAATGRKALSGGVAAVVGVVGFLLDTFLSVVDLLEPARFISVFYYYNNNDVILNGINVAHLLTLVGVSAVAVAVAAWRFEQRDVSI